MKSTDKFFCRNLNIIYLITMARSSCNQFVKNRDKYAAPILLTFKKSKYHKTVCGGTLSMISTFLFLIFLASQCYKIGTFNYQETVTESLLIPELSDNNPIFDITFNETVIASRILNLKPDVMTNDTNTYLAQVFVQEFYVDHKLT